MDRNSAVRKVGFVALAFSGLSAIVACSGSCGSDEKITATTPADGVIGMGATATTAATATATGTTDTALTAREPHEHIAVADAVATGAGTAAPAVGEADANSANTAPIAGTGPIVAPGMTVTSDIGAADLPKGKTRTAAVWIDSGLQVGYTGWFCEGIPSLKETKANSKTVEVEVVDAAPGTVNTGCSGPRTVSTTFTDVSRMAHELKLDPGHGKPVETIKFSSGDMVPNGATATEETGAGINHKHGTTH